MDDEVVSIALRRALRAKRRRPKQALGLNADLRRQLIDACPADGLHGLRDRALIAVGYDSLCRRSELVGLLIEDLRPLPDGGARILVRRAKTDPFGDGRWAHLSPPTMDHLKAWLAAAAIIDGPLLRPLIAGKVGTAPMNPVAVNRTLKNAARRAGLSEDVAAGLSGHSMRIGAAQDLMRAGRDLLHIMTAGGWTSPTVVGGYVREAEVRVWRGEWLSLGSHSVRLASYKDRKLVARVLKAKFPAIDARGIDPTGVGESASRQIQPTSLTNNPKTFHLDTVDEAPTGGGVILE